MNCRSRVLRRIFSNTCTKRQVRARELTLKQHIARLKREMKTLEKIELYRQRLAKWIEDQANGHTYKEPQPEAFSLNSTAEKFMAKNVREKILNLK